MKDTFASFIEVIDEQYHKHIEDVMKSENADGFCGDALKSLILYCGEDIGDVLKVGYHLQALKKGLGHIEAPRDPEGITFGRVKR